MSEDVDVSDGRPALPFFGHLFDSHSLYSGILSIPIPSTLLDPQFPPVEAEPSECGSSEYDSDDSSMYIMMSEDEDDYDDAKSDHTSYTLGTDDTWSEVSYPHSDDGMESFSHHRLSFRHIFVVVFVRWVCWLRGSCLFSFRLPLFHLRSRC